MRLCRSSCPNLPTIRSTLPPREAYRPRILADRLRLAARELLGTTVVRAFNCEAWEACDCRIASAFCEAAVPASASHRRATQRECRPAPARPSRPILGASTGKKYQPDRWRGEIPERTQEALTR